MRKKFSFNSRVIMGIFFVSFSGFAQHLETMGGHELEVSRLTADPVLAGTVSRHQTKSEVSKRSFSRAKMTDANTSAETKVSEKADGTEVIWTRDTTTNPRLGEAWRDPSGMIWGDIVMDQAGDDISMNHKNATEYCKSIGAKLPSKEDFIRLREYFGALPGSDKGYFPQVLPHLTYLEQGKTVRGYALWSSSFLPYDLDHVSIFNSYYGEFDHYYRHWVGYHNPVRCVVSGL